MVVFKLFFSIAFFVLVTQFGGLSSLQSQDFSDNLLKLLPQKVAVVIKAHQAIKPNSLDSQRESVIELISSDKIENLEKSLKIFTELTGSEEINKQYADFLESRDASLMPFLKNPAQTYRQAIGGYIYFPQEIREFGELQYLDIIYCQELYHYRLAYSASFGNPFGLYYLAKIFSHFSINSLPIGEGINPISKIEERYKEIFETMEGSHPFLKSVAEVYLDKKYLINPSELKKNADKPYQQNKYKYAQRYQAALHSGEPLKELKELLSNLIDEEGRYKKDKKYEQLNKVLVLKKKVQLSLGELLRNTHAVNIQASFDLYKASNTDQGFYEMGRILEEKKGPINTNLTVRDIYTKPSMLVSKMTNARHTLAEMSVKEGKIDDAVDLYLKLSIDRRGVHKAAQLREKQKRINEALKLYIKSGALIGYEDAIRLSLGEKRKIDLQRYKEDFSREHFARLYSIAFNIETSPDALKKLEERQLKDLSILKLDHPIQEYEIEQLKDRDNKEIYLYGVYVGYEKEGIFVKKSNLKIFPGMINPEVETLHINCCGITNEDIAGIDQFRNLKYLSLISSFLTDDAIPLITQLSTVTTLSLSLNDISNASIKSLLEMPNLVELDLSHNPRIDDNSVELFLSNISPSLKVVDLNGTSITKQKRWKIEDFYKTR